MDLHRLTGLPQAGPNVRSIQGPTPTAGVFIKPVGGHSVRPRQSVCTSASQGFYVVQAGEESLASVASKFGMSARELKELNYGHKAIIKGDKVPAGTQLRVLASKQVASMQVAGAPLGQALLAHTWVAQLAAVGLVAATIWRTATQVTRQPHVPPAEAALQAEIQEAQLRALSTHNLAVTELLASANREMSQAEARVLDVAQLHTSLLERQRQAAGAISDAAVVDVPVSNVVPLPAQLAQVVERPVAAEVEVPVGAAAAAAAAAGGGGGGGAGAGSSGGAPVNRAPSPVLQDIVDSLNRAWKREASSEPEPQLPATPPPEQPGDAAAAGVAAATTGGAAEAASLEQVPAPEAAAGSALTGAQPADASLAVAVMEASESAEAPAAASSLELDANATVVQFASAVEIHELPTADAAGEEPAAAGEEPAVTAAVGVDACEPPAVAAAAAAAASDWLQAPTVLELQQVSELAQAEPLAAESALTSIVEPSTDAAVVLEGAAAPITDAVATPAAEAAAEATVADAEQLPTILAAELVPEAEPQADVATAAAAVVTDPPDANAEVAGATPGTSPTQPGSPAEGLPVPVPEPEAALMEVAAAAAAEPDAAPVVVLEHDMAAVAESLAAVAQDLVLASDCVPVPAEASTDEAAATQEEVMAADDDAVEAAAAAVAAQKELAPQPPMPVADALAVQLDVAAQLSPVEDATPVATPAGAADMPSLAALAANVFNSVEAAATAAEDSAVRASASAAESAAAAAAAEVAKVGAEAAAAVAAAAAATATAVNESLRAREPTGWVIVGHDDPQAATAPAPAAAAQPAAAGEAATAAEEEVPAPVPAPAAAAAAPEADAKAAADVELYDRTSLGMKTALLETVYQTARGASASAYQRAVAEEMIGALECRNPNARPSDCLGVLSGRWKLVYSSSPQTLLLLSALDALPLIDLVDVYQHVDTTSMTVHNKIDIKTPMPLVSLRADTQFEACSPRALKVQVMRVGMDLFVQTPQLLTGLDFPRSIDLWGNQIDLTPISQYVIEPVSSMVDRSKTLLQQAMKPELDLKSAELPAQWMLTTYLDDTLRVTRDDTGRVFVFLKEVPEQP